jgi:hypothetical protein
MKTQPLILTLLALTFALAPQSLNTASARGAKGDYAAQLASPRAGDVVRPGQVVRVEWTATFPDVDLTMCETEVLLSIDGGKTYNYVTSQRDPKVQYFNWTVPNVPPRGPVTAILDIRFGCLGIYPETPSPQIHSTFVISPN